MLKFVVMFSLAIPICARCQEYADSPFYMATSTVPSAAHVEGWQHGSIQANGVIIDLSELVLSSSPGFDEIRGWSVLGRSGRPSPYFSFLYPVRSNESRSHLRVRFARGTY
jgi:hypothetical protein